jgi:hypothetical protein
MRLLANSLLVGLAASRDAQVPPVILAAAVTRDHRCGFLANRLVRAREVHGVTEFQARGAP